MGNFNVIGDRAEYFQARLCIRSLSRWKRDTRKAWGRRPQESFRITSRALEVRYNFTLMAQSVLQVYIHIIFSTHNRDRCLSEDIRPRLWAYLAKTSEGIGYAPILFGGHIDHVHGLVRMGKSVTPPEWIKQLKQRSNEFLKRECGFPGGFSWQTGYGAFSVNPDNLDTIAEYIRKQEEHHRKMSFQDEYLKFMKKYGVQVAPEYLLDD